MNEAISTATRVLDVLEQVTEAKEIRSNLDLPLFELGILDSLGTVQLIIALSDAMGIEIAPSEVERDQWATPRKIIDYVQKRSGA